VNQPAAPAVFPGVGHHREGIVSDGDFSRQPGAGQDVPFQPAPGGTAGPPDPAPGAGEEQSSPGWRLPDDTAVDPWPADGYWPPDSTLAGFPGAGAGGASPGQAPARSRYPRRGRRRWPVLAAIAAAAAAAGSAAVLLAGRPPASPAGPAAAAPPAARASGSPSPSPSSSPSPPAAAAPLTLAQAEAVVARYTAVNNDANAQRSDTLLATVETASSYAIDAGSYLFRQGTPPYPPFAPARAAYYIPRDEPGTGPRWFAVLVANAFASDPQTVTSSEYLLFTQQAPGSPWRDAAEPYLLPGSVAPEVTAGPDGLATAVSAGTASLAVAPGQLPAGTAAALDGAARPVVAVPAGLADAGDKRFWQGRLPGGTVTDAHAPAGGTFALRTAGGGALVFYAVTAQLTVTAPPGATVRLAVPGFYSASQPLTRAGMTYLEQFAVYDPPAGGQPPAVIADYSGITGKN
jgi:hypothetical protein